MPDFTRDRLDALLGVIERAVGNALADAGVTVGSGTVPTLSSFEMAFDHQFATGYDSGTGLTTLPFTADLSEAGGGGGFAGTDIVTL